MNVSTGTGTRWDISFEFDKFANVINLLIDSSSKAMGKATIKDPAEEVIDLDKTRAWDWA